MGSSWALGIPTLGGVPYMNGRNQESSSEAVNAYYAVALYGHVMAQVDNRSSSPRLSLLPLLLLLSLMELVSLLVL